MKWLLPILFLSGCTQTGKFFLNESNDWFSSGGHSDRNFTQGTEIGYQTQNWAFTAGQHIYTPEDLTDPDLIEDENPYAAWLFFDTSYTLDQDTFGVTLGTVGPSAQGEPVQKWFHELCGCDDPQGWGNQIKDEPGIILHAKREWFNKFLILDGILPGRTLSQARVRLGNIHTDLYAEHELRFWEYPEAGWDVYPSVAAGAAAVARNIFYDGNTFKNSHSVDTEPFVGHMRAALTGRWRRLELGVSWNGRTKDYSEQGGFMHTFGMIHIGFSFTDEQARELPRRMLSLSK